MEKYAAFARTCIGASHLKRNIVCQDASLAVNGEKYVIAAVADGHGSPWYLRTDKGAQLSVKSAEECIKEFLDNLENAEERLGNEKERFVLFSQLWRSIVARWHEYAKADFMENPFTEEELDSIPEDRNYYREKYLSGDYLNAYGSTLITAAATESFAFCMQIGDGKCVAVGADGAAWEPVPWDSRCYDCVTTSICQEDAVLSGRFCYFDRESIPPAIFIGSDGVDDSYCSDEILYAFYQGLALTFAQSGVEESVRQLEAFLPEMSRRGSGDDMSAAGIINPAGLKAAEEKLLSIVEARNTKASETAEPEQEVAEEDSEAENT